MKTLNTFLTLLSKTESRDKILRLFQYLCLHSIEHAAKGSTLKVYEQMRMTRKLLRFLRTLEYSTKIREQLPALKRNLGNVLSLLKTITSILQNLFNLLFFLFDHRVCLSELEVIDKQQRVVYYPPSMKFYFLQNVFGILNNFMNIVTITVHKQKEGEQGTIKKFIIDLIKCFLDCFVALYYWKGTISAQKAGIVGVVTSAIGICQSLNYI